MRSADFLQAEAAMHRLECASPAALARLVEGDIIPRLLVTCRGQAQGAVPGAASAAMPGPKDPAPKEVAMLASTAIREDASLLMAQIDAHMARGIGLDALLIDWLAPAARLLGEWWEQDACDFIDVTMGLWRMQEAVHDLTSRGHHPIVLTDNRRSVLFAVAPGDDHSFGSLVVEEMFIQAGWASEGWRKGSLDELQALVGDRHFDLLALSASSDQQTETLPDVIRALRAASSNPELIVMVGGWPFTHDPLLADAVGADASAPDARAAVRIAEQLMEMRQMHPAAPARAG